jgi:hypothetical protein
VQWTGKNVEANCHDLVIDAMRTAPTTSGAAEIAGGKLGHDSQLADRYANYRITNYEPGLPPDRSLSPSAYRPYQMICNNSLPNFLIQFMCATRPVHINSMNK